jgi:hypothetical protein
MNIFQINILIFNFDVFYMFRIWGFIFRKTAVYAVMLWYARCKKNLPLPNGQSQIYRCHHHHHHHHISVMELGHLLIRSGLTYPEVSSKVCRDSFRQMGNSVSLPWVIYYEAFYLHVVSSFSCVPVICPKLVLFLIPLQFVYLLCNLFKCILLFFSRISYQCKNIKEKLYKLMQRYGTTKYAA